MTKIPTNDELLKLFLFGLGSTGFGILFIWIPIFGQIFFFIGGFCLLISLTATITKIYNKMLK